MKYQTEKADDPRQIDVEEYIAEKLGRPVQRREAIATTPGGEKIDASYYQTINTMYAPLRRILEEAFSQASVGKGFERHANGKPFLDQPIMHLARAHGIGFVTGQASKKCQEAVGMVSRFQLDAAKRELLGSIVYLCAAAIWIEEVAEESGVDKV